jgi:alpha-mannosidase
LLAGSILTAKVVAQDASSANNHSQIDLTKQPTLYVVGYAHLDTEWRWEYPQVIDEYLLRTMEDNFKLMDKYPNYVLNFSGANRYRLMKEYFPEDFAKLKEYVNKGQWYPAGSSMEEGDVNAPSAEAIIRQNLYGNQWFRKELGKASAEYMLPDCFGFPASLPSILAHSGIKGFSTQKLSWGSSAPVGGEESLEKTPRGTPFNVGVWVGPDGKGVLAGVNPGSYGDDIDNDLSALLPARKPNPALEEVREKIKVAEQKVQDDRQNNKESLKADRQALRELYDKREFLRGKEKDAELSGYRNDWAKRVLHNGEVTGIYTDYHYYGTGDIGGSPSEKSIEWLEKIVTKGTIQTGDGKEVKVGDGPVHVISSRADQMFLDITPEQAKRLPRYTGELELTNHSAGSLTSQAYIKRWLRQQELLADAAEKSSVAAQWLGGRTYPLQRLNDAWTLTMGAHFHDLAAGTATPRSYQFAWNDDVIAMNQFADVLTDSVSAVASGMNTRTQGVPVVVYNPLNIAREDVVEAVVSFSGEAPKQAHVVAPDGTEHPAQISNGKVVFVANVPSVGYAVYDVRPGAATASASNQLHVTESELENKEYRIKLNQDGDVASIFDKRIGRELLASPARLALSYDNPGAWPAWNMDWDQEQAAPREYVSGPAKIRVVENGPVRVAVEVERETAGSRFKQIIQLSAGDAGKRVEFGNVIDWNSRERNLKAVFPLTASNDLATYNWDIGTIERTSATPEKFEVPSHQWIDLTDASKEFGATILTDSKNGSDKPNDNTLRLTLIRTPGTRAGYVDEATQDIGHHEFVYGFAGHANGWRDEQTDWQAQRLDAPLIAFQTTPHLGALGRSFSLLRVNNPRIRVLAVKKAEQSDEIVVRLVELDGKAQPNVRIAFAKAIREAREINGQEQPVGSATVADGAIVTSFGAYQPRTFALRLSDATVKVAPVRSTSVALNYDVATTSNDKQASTSGFDGKGNALPAEMLPEKINFNGVEFKLTPAAGRPNAIVAQGQSIQLPAGAYNRVYILAASADGDQKATFEANNRKIELNIEDWGGFIGQWDDRVWTAKDVSHDHADYGEMVGLNPGFIKRADLAWYCSHHHDSAGKNVTYAYSYLFGYGIDIQPGTKTLKLPSNDKVRILAISVANENPEVKAVQPLYDELPIQNRPAVEFFVAHNASAN